MPGHRVSSLIAGSVALTSLWLALAGPEVSGATSLEPDISPKGAITAAEAAVEHLPHWRATSIYCEPPKAAPTTNGRLMRRYHCQWVKQSNPLLPYELVDVEAVYATSGRYLYSLVLTTFANGDPARCKVQLVGALQHVTCSHG